jgi:hypothetical protein
MMSSHGEILFDSGRVERTHEESMPFNAEQFLELLLEDVKSSSEEGKPFVADPDQLGPRLMLLQQEFLLQAIRLKNIAENGWKVCQTEEGKWWVLTEDVAFFQLHSNDALFDSYEEALDAAILARLCKVSP